MNPVAEELGLVDAAGPGAVLALAAATPIAPPVAQAQTTSFATPAETTQTATVTTLTPSAPTTATAPTLPRPDTPTAPATVTDINVQMASGSGSAAPAPITSAPSPDKDADGLCDDTEQVTVLVVHAQLVPGLSIFRCLALQEIAHLADRICRQSKCLLSPA